MLIKAAHIPFYAVIFAIGVVFAFAGSPRVNGNSSALSNEFARGAMEAGHSVEKIDVARK